MTVHQIWIGEVMPNDECGWVAGVRKHAQEAGWAHKLWTWDELLKTYGSEPLAGVFIKLMADFPMATTYTLMADYYRLRVLADAGGVYLDADFKASGWPMWPDGVDVADVYVLGEFTNHERACNGFFYCRNADSMRRAAKLAECYLLARLPVDAADLPSRYVEMVRRDGGRGGLARCGVGPGFIRRRVLPAWMNDGVKVTFIDKGLVGHRQWDGGAVLTHQATAHWHEGGKSSDDPFWPAVAEKAKTLSRQRMMDALPAHLRPFGGVKPPVRVRCADAAHGNGGMCADAMANGGGSAVGLMFRIPRDVRRVVALSNVTTGFSPDMLPLRAGDLVIHCNHSRHREAAMAVKGTRHWLFVRHGKGRDPRGWHWYHEGTFDGFEKVFFIDDASMLAPFRWFKEFRQVSKKSPTTGFIVANMMREVAPNLPLVLGGFEPGVKHGTPQWDGHDWHVEAEWYKQRGFTLYRPRQQARILVLVASCLGYSGRDIRAKSGKETYEQRRACRMAWLHRLTPDNVEAVMVVGRGETVHEPLVRQLDVDDDFMGLPGKVKAAFSDALERSDFDWLVKCDDDTFLHLERLVQYVAGLPIGSRDVYGAPTANNQKDRVCGGGGYVLHRDVVAAIVRDAAFPERGREDVEVCRAIMRYGGRVVREERFNALAEPSPARGNNLISCHHLTPRQMMQVHTDCWKI